MDRVDRELLAHLPEHEQDVARAIERHLGSARTYIDQCDTAIALFDLCGAQIQEVIKAGNHGAVQLLGAWQQIAARDFVMSVYHFAKARKGLSIVLGQCPTLQQTAGKRVGEGNALFKAAFPHMRKTSRMIRPAWPRMQSRVHSCKEPFKSPTADRSRSATC